FGAVGYPPDAGRFHKFLEPVFATAQHHEEAVIAETATHEEEAGETGAVAEAAEHEEGHHISNETIITFAVISTILALGGILLSWLVFMKRRIDPVAFAVDHPGLYNFLYKKWYIDEVYNAEVVFPMRRLAMYLWQIIDVKVIDGTLMGVARGFGDLSQGLRTLQTGLVRNYALAIALGMVLIIGIYFAAFSSLFR
ncbi:MAG: hypothetical protein KC438_16025, partial [Thermomicrobiales bacterium]|nr:hypothetical protein [Thermomicrobiales bacterium]